MNKNENKNLREGKRKLKWRISGGAFIWKKIPQQAFLFFFTSSPF